MASVACPKFNNQQYLFRDDASRVLRKRFCSFFFASHTQFARDAQAKSMIVRSLLAFNDQPFGSSRSEFGPLRFLDSGTLA